MNLTGFLAIGRAFVDGAGVVVVVVVVVLVATALPLAGLTTLPEVGKVCKAMIKTTANETNDDKRICSM